MLRRIQIRQKRFCVLCAESAVVRVYYRQLTQTAQRTYPNDFGVTNYSRLGFFKDWISTASLKCADLIPTAPYFSGFIKSGRPGNDEDHGGLGDNDVPTYVSKKLPELKITTKLQGIKMADQCDRI